MSSRKKKVKKRGESVILRTKKNEPNFIMDWINTQSNISESLRQLIEKDVAENGLRDVNEELLNKAAVGVMGHHQLHRTDVKANNKMNTPVVEETPLAIPDKDTENKQTGTKHTIESIGTNRESPPSSHPIIGRRMTVSKQLSKVDKNKVIEQTHQDTPYELSEKNSRQPSSEDKIMIEDVKGAAIQEENAEVRNPDKKEESGKKKVNRGRIDINQWS
ncbi:hypothetical protein BpOF4_21884 (plasmid) [Alkalihalophilus pseudofirmus OF4]|uniref:Uncharacterized protein n=1 Tax=Alkalihalophilus pseudofirmus (strain ATCC BAA-2126 / JCM 17055 / OF4) TaxID=398511 RepID=D3G1Z6_ALKPO|nr:MULTISPECIES: hypothetical protein [Alkalihalophilus]ADC52372.1 hypothetical protein BpOF4_21884 [Alkalihalophilus pseudofirmus OF4]MED1603451.1 hypothetical protein [Alkalihalophilus marmarensis]